MITPIPTYKFLLPNASQTNTQPKCNIVQIIACILFFIFIFYFFARKSYIIGAICAVAFASYLAINMRRFLVNELNNVDDNLARYIDWSITTPLLFLTLMIKCNITNPSIYLFFITLDVIMIYLGYLGATSKDPKSLYTFFGFSCFFYLILFALLLPYKPPLGLFLFLFIAWGVYPLLWILHETKKGNMTNQNYDYSIAALDIFSKIGYGLILPL